MKPTSTAGSAHSATDRLHAGRVEIEEPTLRPLIAASWQRSSACGIPPEQKSELPYDDDFDNDSPLMRAARPVLDRLVTTLADAPITVLLADGQARLVQRWVGEKSLYNALDQSHVAPGFGFAEEFAGTNGVGTVLEESKVVAVRGEEHYVEFLRHFSCVGVPIHHPITRGIEGILDITCLARDYNPLMPPLLVEAVKHIETRLTQMSSPSEVALLEEFVRACRSHRGAVVGISPNVILTNPAAVEHLTPMDQAVLWDVAGRLTAAGRSEGPVDLAGGRFRLRCLPVAVNSRKPRGMVLRLDTDQARRSRGGNASAAGRYAPARSLPGRSPQWRQVMSRIRDLSDVRQPVAITGEPGTGKLRLAKHLHELSGRECGLRVFDAAALSEVAPADLVDRVSQTLGLGDDVILRRVDQLPPEALARLQALVGYGPDLLPGQVAGRLVITARTATDGSEAMERTLARFPHHVWVPPLHQHAEDIADLVPALLAELTGQHTAYCSLLAVQALMRYPWPGNVAELRDVLAAAMAAGAGREIQPRHLPAWVLKRAHQRQLSALERSERNLIIETLASVGDNRTEAARILGIGRATLYRKIRSLGISTGQELVH
jgi:sigma-54 dependent transcriptional regulator, acetoin dehydrogenase operon transcriptional activator AcoR